LIAAAAGGWSNDADVARQYSPYAAPYIVQASVKSWSLGVKALFLERAVKAGIAAEMIDDLVARLRAANHGGYEWVTSPFLLGLVLLSRRGPEQNRQGQGPHHR
jgi:hypothetical protein